jgi:hypothetical protein
VYISSLEHEEKMQLTTEVDIRIERVRVPLFGSGI